MPVTLELYARGRAEPAALWALVADLTALPRWTDAEVVEAPAAPVAGSAFRVRCDGRWRAWRVRSVGGRVLEVATDLPDGELALGARVTADDRGTRLILVASFASGRRWAERRYRLSGRAALQRRMDRWARRALEVAGAGRTAGAPAATDRTLTMENPDPQEPATLDGILAGLAADGFEGQFAARPGATVVCFTCRTASPAADVHVEALRRMEGASDPADMLAVVALVCPHCGARGTAALGYGPDASFDDAEVLIALEDSREGPGLRP